jgi:hypothetical protein
MQGQALMDIAQAGLRLASGRNAQGVNVAGDSFAGQLASAGMGLPEKLAARAGQFQQEERAVKLAALKAAETNVEGQRKLFGQIIKSAGASPFGKGDWDWAILNRPGFLQKYAEGKTTVDEDNLIESAIAHRQAPRTEYRTDPVTKQVYSVQGTGVLPSFVSAAQAKRGGAGPSAQTTGTGSYAVAPPESPLVRDANGNVIDIGATEDPNAPPAIDRTLGTVPPSEQEQSKGSKPLSATPPVVFERNTPTIYNLAGMGTGPLNVAQSWIYSKPIMGEFIDASGEQYANTFLSNAVNLVNRGLATNPRFSEGERVQIQKELNLAPKLLDRAEAYQQRMIAVDDLLLQIRTDAYRKGYMNKNLGPADIQDARLKVEDVDGIRSLMGVPPRIYSEKEREGLAVGTPYLWFGKTLAVKKAPKAP